MSYRRAQDRAAAAALRMEIAALKVTIEAAADEPRAMRRKVAAIRRLAEIRSSLLDALRGPGEVLTVAIDAPEPILEKPAREKATS